MMRFDNKSDDEIEKWARKYEEQGKTDDAGFHQLLEERTKRRQKKQRLSLEKSLAHLKACALRREFTSYGDLAKASDVPWSIARHQMNGLTGHLDTLLDVCKSQSLPLLTAICVNQHNLETGKLGEEALVGFVHGAKRLGLEVVDPEEFHEKCVQECFAWGKGKR